MDDLYLIRTIVDIEQLHRWAAHRGLGDGAGLDEGAALHHLLSETFGKRVLQPFRLMVSRGAKRASLYSYATQPVLALQQIAEMVAAPEAHRVLFINDMEGKPLVPDLWPSGRRLGFDICIRPVVRLSSAIAGSKFKKGAEIDALLAQRLRQDAPVVLNGGHTRESVYLAWLDARLGPAAELDLGASRLASFERVKVWRNGTGQDGPTATIHGTLTVKDAAAFSVKLAQGVGRHRAYGYGMLLLRPTQKC